MTRAVGHSSGRERIETGAVTSIESGAGVSTLHGRFEDGPVDVTVDAVGDLASARRWSATMRRVLAVELRIDADRVSCSLQGLGHRLPVNRRVPLRAALGLAELGVPVVLRR